MNARTTLRASLAAAAASVLVAAVFAAPPATAPAPPPATAPKAPDSKAPAAKDDAKPATRRGEAWPLSCCALSSAKLDDKAVTSIYSDPSDPMNDGRELKFCCKNCLAKFKKDPQAGLKKANEAIIAELGKSYPLTTCVVSGEKLDDTAKTIVVGNRVFKVCCGKCATMVAKDYATYAAKVDAAAKSDAKDATGGTGKSDSKSAK